MSTKPAFRASLAVALITCSAFAPARAQEQLEGDAKLACEALLCLAASTRPAECMPSIRRYFSISFRRFGDTLRGRLNFLNMCPIISQPHMTAYKNSIVNGAGRCDAANINQANFVITGEGESYIGNAMPSYCLAYYGDGLQQASAPVYVGEPLQGGYWVEAQDYPQALQAYRKMRSRSATALSESN